MTANPPVPFDPTLVELLQCPKTGVPLRIDGDSLAAVGRDPRYRVNDLGVLLFAEDQLSADAEFQQKHYDEIAAAYTANLGYPHTQEYVAYLDRKLDGIIGDRPLGRMAEFCCGRGEAIQLLKGRYDLAVGVDISQEMLNIGRTEVRDPAVVFTQGDATSPPLASDAFDTVVILGGIHHINDRLALFREVRRVLKPGGRFLWREPVDDFWLWRSIRKLIYRISPLLDHETEHPLRHDDTMADIEAAGLLPEAWKTCGFLGFCVFMNSDVLIFNRLFRFVPGIRPLTRLSAAIDDAILGLPGLRRDGLIVVGSARKPDV